MLWFPDLNDSATSNVLLAAPLFYVKRIPETEIQILGTVSSVRQERSSSVTNAPVLAKSVIETKDNHDKNVEETKRDLLITALTFLRWPDGKYCIYKKGSRCPTGLDEGFVIWDDENKDNKNSKYGDLPEGLFNEDSKIFFCCSTTGSASKEITLPNKAPFLLFAYESYLCQKVKGMRVETEFVKFDDEDRGNIDYEGGEFPFGIHRADKDHMFFLCYYTPEGQNSTLMPVSADNKSKSSSSSKNFILKDGLKKHKSKSENKQVDKLEELEKLRNSEKMMDAFLASTAPHNKETNKNERTKTIIKTIRIPERENTTSIVVTTAGIVLGIVVLGAVVGIVVIKHIRSNRDGINVDSLDEQIYTASSRRSSFTTSEDEVELTEADFEDELVEDQYLPSDSELKSGLELMFLKQQRHYWTRKKKP
ncbi:hypothetical protein pdam_00002704 [Pocillopora damicornis]|uniref:Apextrin C-terminal domain-containing protein n=1 Tax=Pocillopora damicornis TaxID=46731 RepID=A0A3M6TT99_POCDA|nr:hypothetical protein pdam_00002704 [Pocillopora damicornis]